MTVARLTVGLVCASLSLTASASAADFTKIGPQATADKLLAARPALQEPAIAFVYKIEGSGTPDLLTVNIATDFTIVERGLESRIYDYALRRIVVVNKSANTMQNGSLYALADFFAAETFNRRYQRRLLSSLHTADAANMMDPFWVQSELHVMDAEDGIPAIDRRADSDRSVHFSFAGAEVASYTLSKQVLSLAERAGLAKFLRMNSSLHPTIIDDIAASGFLPQRLSFALPPMHKMPNAIWTLQSVSSAKVTYPIEADARPILGPATKPLVELLPTMQAAVAGQTPSLRSAEDYRAGIESAMSAGNLF